MALSKREYAALLRKQIRQTDRLRAEGRRAAVRLLRQLRDRVNGEIAQTDFDVFRLDRTRTALAELTNDFSRQYSGRLNELTDEMLELETSFRKQIVGKADQPIAGQIIVPRRALELSAEFRVDLVQDLADESLNKIANEISLAALDPAKGPGDAVRAIQGQVLPLTRKDGVTIGALARAETIAKNEMTRQLNIVSNAQNERDADFLRDRGEKVLKGWIDSGLPNVRPTHREATLTYGIDGTIGPIPLNQLFRVGRARLRHPQDPAGPPEETINCNCKEFLWTAAIAEAAA